MIIKNPLTTYQDFDTYVYVHGDCQSDIFVFLCMCTYVCVHVSMYASVLYIKLQDQSLTFSVKSRFSLWSNGISFMTIQIFCCSTKLTIENNKQTSMAVF